MRLVLCFSSTSTTNDIPPPPPPRNVYHPCGIDIIWARVAYLTIKHFRYFLKGRQFTIWTNHKLLIYILFPNSTTYSPRELWQMSFISELVHELALFTVVTTPLRMPSLDKIFTLVVSRVTSSTFQPLLLFNELTTTCSAFVELPRLCCLRK